MRSDCCYNKQKKIVCGILAPRIRTPRKTFTKQTDTNRIETSLTINETNNIEDRIDSNDGPNETARITSLPDHLLVVGAGFVWSRLGAKVTVAKVLHRALTSVDNDGRNIFQKMRKNKDLNHLMNQVIN